MDDLLAADPDGNGALKVFPKVLSAALFLFSVGYARATASTRRVLVAPYSGVISPVAAEFMTSAIHRAEVDGDEAVIFELDTPGGLDTSMREIVKGILGSKVPVIVYVYPQGARAASAGVFVTMAAHVAAMAPGTNIGAAHPIQIPTGLPAMGQEKNREAKTDSTLEDKIVNDASAYLKSIAQERGRNETWASQAVSKSTSIPAIEAMRMKVVDLVAPSLENLLKELDGREISSLNRTLRTANAQIDRYEMTRRQRILAALSDPNVAMILMSVGAGGVFIELYNPGLILPGIVGAISLVLAFYSFQTLSASYAGVLLLLFGMLLFLLEIKVVSYGMLTLGGIAATVLGVLMLFQHQAIFGLQVSWTIVASGLAGILAITALCSYLVYTAYRRKPATGVESMIGSSGRTATELAPQGKILIHGERWNAISVSGNIPADAEVTVDAIEGMTLRVRRNSN